MRSSSDLVTFYVRKSLDLLLVNNPVATSAGVLLGVVLQWLFRVLGQVNETLIFLALNSSLLHTIPLGVLIMNLKGLVRSRSSDPRLSVFFQAIEEIDKRAGLSDNDRKRLYESVLMKCLDDEDVVDLANKALK